MLPCSHCSKEFKYNSERARHEMSHCPGFECEVCSKKFSFLSALRRHRKQHERTGSVKCEECNRKFRDDVLLKRHVKYAHKGTFSCIKCQATFNSDQALRTHMKIHKPESERRFKCGFTGCTKSFNFSHHLKHHELTHTNDKQHFCAVCGKGFIQSHHLKTHLKSHDPAEWLCCDFEGCKKKFSTEYARKRHAATHKMKTDSGISSDSSSSDAFTSKEYGKDTILCASCGEHVSQSDYKKHSEQCDENPDRDRGHSMIPDSSQTNDLNDDDLEHEVSLDSWKTSADIKSENIFDGEISIDAWTPSGLIKYKDVTSKPIFDKYIGDCKTAPGGCIMGPEFCVCVDKDIENYDFTPIQNSNGAVGNNNSMEHNVGNFESNSSQNVLKNKVNTRNCEECDCTKSYSSKTISFKNDVPNIVCRVDGVIKIKDLFDIDMPVRELKVKDNVPFSTCKDVIGNCIVGGNEGCLCARMMMDDQQAMEQEIEDITPKPKTEI